MGYHLREAVRHMADEHMAIANHLRVLADMDEMRPDPFICEDTWPEEIELPSVVEKPTYDRDGKHIGDYAVSQTSISDFAKPAFAKSGYKINTLPGAVLNFLRENFANKHSYSDIESSLEITHQQAESALWILKKDGAVRKEWRGKKSKFQAS